jgi:hypothetical protein
LPSGAREIALGQRFDYLYINSIFKDRVRGDSEIKLVNNFNYIQTLKVNYSYAISVKIKWKGVKKWRIKD